MTDERTDRPFIILDRDGTLIEDCGYLTDPGYVRLLPGAAQALRDFRNMGFGLVVITNQSAVGRGFITETQLSSIHERLDEILKNEGIQLDGLYYCPHKPDEGCACRKPELGLIERAARELQFAAQESIVIGDKASDIEMGQRAGSKTILVRTGYGAQVVAENLVDADHVVDDLPAAAALIRHLMPRKSPGFVP